jgi:hypothetical protein
MFMASKMIELRLPSLSDWCHVSAKAFTAPQIETMEARILKALHFWVRSRMGGRGEGGA